MRKKRRRTYRPPAAVDELHHAGLRAIAVLEALKGVAVVLLSFGILTLLHKDVEEVAENMLFHLHISPVHRIGETVLHAASKITDTRLWEFTIGGLAYAGRPFHRGLGPVAQPCMGRVVRLALRCNVPSPRNCSAHREAELASHRDPRDQYPNRVIHAVRAARCPSQFAPENSILRRIGVDAYGAPVT